MTATPSGTLRRRWLDALLPEVAFDGWTEAAASRAASVAGLSEGEQALAAPRGVDDLIDAFFDEAEVSAKAALAVQDLAAMGTTARVKAGVLAWLAALQPDREAVRRATSRGMVPWKSGPALQRAWRRKLKRVDRGSSSSRGRDRHRRDRLSAAALAMAIVFAAASRRGRWPSRVQRHQRNRRVDRRRAPRAEPSRCPSPSR